MPSVRVECGKATESLAFVFRSSSAPPLETSAFAEPRWQSIGNVSNPHRTARITELGEEFDKSALVTTLKEQVFPEAQRLGVLASDLPRAADLQTLCEEFRLARVAETLKKLAATESDDFGNQVSSLAQIDNEVLGVIERFLSTMSRTLAALEKNLQAELAAGEGMLESSKERIEQTLDRMSEQLNVIGGSTI